MGLGSVLAVQSTAALGAVEVTVVKRREPVISPMPLAKGFSFSVIWLLRKWD